MIEASVVDRHGRHLVAEDRIDTRMDDIARKLVLEPVVVESGDRY